MRQMQTSGMDETLAEVWARAEALAAESPKLRARDVASRLGVTEATLVAAHPGAVHLGSDFKGILEALPSLGEVMALTRNESAVHEKRGVYPAPTFNGSVGLFHSEKIDLRVFLRAWHAGFALVELRGEKVRRSLQFFDHHGDAVHKVWLEEESDVGAFAKIVERFRSEAPYTQPTAPAPKAPLADDAIDAAGMREAWSALEDTHDFFPMLVKYKVGRLQALRLAEERFAVPVSPAIGKDVIERAAKEEVPIMVFVGSRGMVQIHSGPVQSVRPLGTWMNILDRGFNLHLRTDRIAEAWRVTKPTLDGDVNAIELFDGEGELIAQFFGVRDRGVPEAAEWRQLLSSLEEVHRVR